jgi:uncharacterized glyoxalase superfamily protein PhnB
MMEGHDGTALESNTMEVNKYVNFAGKCAEAFRFYEKHLGGEIGMMMTHGQAPDQSIVKPETELASTSTYTRFSGVGLEIEPAP